MNEVSLSKEPSVRKHTCVDLCSGLGGFSQAFVNHGWKVITVDIEPKFNPTVVADVTKIDWNEFKQAYLNGESPDVLLASPPCNHFSLASWSFPRKGVKEALAIVGACFEGVAVLKPKYWLIENPRGRLRHLAPNKPKMTIYYSDFDSNYPAQKPTDLWGNIPLSLVKHQRRPRPFANIKDKEERHHLWGKKYTQFLGSKPEERAKIPLGVSEAVYESCQRLLEVANQK